MNRRDFLKGLCGTAIGLVLPWKINQDTWHHAACIFKADTARQVVLNGTVYDGAFWNTTLSADEIAVLANGISPLYVRPESLIAYWPLLSAGE